MTSQIFKRYNGNVIKFKKYKQSYYQHVCDFLMQINKENNYHNNWTWARFEWMVEHPLTNKTLLPSMGLWFDDESLIGAALFDMYFGEAFAGVLTKYQYIYPEILHYAYDYLNDENGLGIAIHDDDKKAINEAIKQGFKKVAASETICEISLNEEIPIRLPEGFKIETFDAQKKAKEMEWLFWQGFDHGDNKKQFLAQYSPSKGKRPHFNPYLCIVIKNKDGELVASASTWYDPKVDYAYLEPVCVIPKYRKMGLGKNAIYVALNHARELGAKIGIVNSDQPFYEKIGFKKESHYSFYWKKE